MLRIKHQWAMNLKISNYRLIDHSICNLKFKFFHFKKRLSICRSKILKSFKFSYFIETIDLSTFPLI
jgi:hypothetical protein